jgi:hypothetical protein
MPESGQGLRESTPPPHAGTVGDEEAEEAPYGQAFQDFFAGNRFHEPSFGEIEKGKTNGSTGKHGNQGLSDMGRTEGSSQPVALGFYLEFFELHICKYIDV